MHNRRWVTAAPFRAHLTHLCASTELPWSVIALHAGLPVGLVHHLLDTRPGRGVERIAPKFARQVLALKAQPLAELRSALVPAAAARHAAGCLLDRRWTTNTLAWRLHDSVVGMDALVAGQRSHVPALLELRLRALVATAEPAPGARRRDPASIAA